jgi:ubiquinone/menaquinone biosynthesis C-methylase UbiE
MISKRESASSLHEKVPPDWYFRSIKENLLQRFWHKRRFKEVSKLLEKVDGKALDIGSADGVFTKVVLEKTGASKITGIDVLVGSVKWAETHWKRNKKMEFRVADAHKLPFSANTFSVVVCLEVLEHVFDPRKVLSEIKRVLKKEGYAVLLVPTDSMLFKIIWFFWCFYRGRIWKDTHLHTYKNNYLIQLSEKVGLKIVENKKFMLDMLQVVKVRKIK